MFCSNCPGLPSYLCRGRSGAPGGPSQSDGQEAAVRRHTSTPAGFLNPSTLPTAHSLRAELRRWPVVVVHPCDFSLTPLSHSWPCSTSQDNNSCFLTPERAHSHPAFPWDLPGVFLSLLAPGKKGMMVPLSWLHVWRNKSRM